MKTFQTPKESPTKIIRKINLNNKPFNQVNFNRNQHNNQFNLKTSPTTPFYRSKSNKRFKLNIPKLNNQFNKNYELEQRNKNFYKKLLEIKTHNNSKKFSAKNLFNSNWKAGYVKLEIMNLAQQNLYMLKRLYDQKSQYSAKKLEKEYQKFQSYKKIMSKFPGIDNNKFKSLINDSYFLKSKKSEQSDKSDFLPTINYVKDGSMISFKKHNLKEIKKNDNKIISPKNLKKMFFNENLNKNNSNINNKKEEKIEFEFEFDKHNEDLNKKK